MVIRALFHHRRHPCSVQLAGKSVLIRRSSEWKLAFQHSTATKFFKPADAIGKKALIKWMEKYVANNNRGDI